MRYPFSLLTSILLCLTCACSAQDSPFRLYSGGPLHPLQANMDIRHYTISLNIDIPAKSIAGYTEIKFNLQTDADTLLVDLARQFMISKILMNGNGEALKMSRDTDRVFITGRKPFKQGSQNLRIYYSGQPQVAQRPPWIGGFTWTKDKAQNPWVVINCQMEGGKVYFPCKDHPSDEPNEGVDLFITVPKGLVVGGPGLLKNVKKIGKDKTQFHWKTNYTISNYCVLFNIGKYKVITKSYTTINGNTVPIEFYVLEQDTAYAKKVIEIRERDTRILEKYFGEYPWVKEKIGIIQVSNPGMEHQTMISYGDRFDYEKIGGQDYSANLFHEFAHEWWANKVTNKDWAHMWVQEGFATYAEALCFRELAGEDGYHRLIKWNRMRISNKFPLVQGEGLSTQFAYTSDIYSKGAFFLHTLRYLMGDSSFFPALKGFATNPEFTYDKMVTTEDLEKWFSAKAGTNLKPLFDFYVRSTEKLNVTVKQKGDSTYIIRIANFFMPLPIDIKTDAGIERLVVDKAGAEVKSAVPPVIDPMVYYLKTVLYLD